MKSLKITILSDADSWKNAHLPILVQKLRKQGHRTHWIHRIDRIPGGDLLFSLGFTKIIPPASLAKTTHNLVIHESALPHGRGLSPLSWQILEGRKKITLTLFESVK